MGFLAKKMVCQIFSSSGQTANRPPDKIVAKFGRLQYTRESLKNDSKPLHYPPSPKAMAGQAVAALILKCGVIMNIKNRCLFLLSWVAVLAIGIYLISTTYIITKDGHLYIGQAQQFGQDPAGVIKRSYFGYPFF